MRRRRIIDSALAMGIPSHTIGDHGRYSSSPEFLTRFPTRPTHPPERGVESATCSPPLQFDLLSLTPLRIDVFNAHTRQGSYLPTLDWRTRSARARGSVSRELHSRSLRRS